MMPVAPQLTLPTCPLQRKTGTFLGLGWRYGSEVPYPLIPGERDMVSARNLLGTRPRPLGLFRFMEKGIFRILATGL